MYVLGIKPSLGNRDVFQIWGVHDGGACLLKDGNIVAAASEERFTRRKRASDTFPSESIKFVLNYEGIGIDDIDTIAIGRNPKKILTGVTNRIKGIGQSLIPSSRKDLLDSFEKAKAVIGAYSGITERRVEQRTKNLPGGEFNGRYRSISHHQAHAASAYHCSPFSEQITITIDGRGEHDSTVLWDRNLNRIKEFPRWNSIGLLYSYATQYLGYRHGGDAGKVMGLAPYGEYREEFEQGFNELTETTNKGYDVTAITDANDPSAVLEETFGPRREYPEEFTQRHRDFAYHLQRRTEEIVSNLVRHHVYQTGVSKVALAGGVAMNCKLNREILSIDCVDDLFIQPAADDSGIPLGAALSGYRLITGDTLDPEFNNIYFGPEYDNEEIRDVLETAKLKYKIPENLERDVAQRLADGELVGWFQGRMEFGARALGNRSILADPRSQDSLDRVNANVKHREGWRPFAPSILADNRDEYLEGGEGAPYMVLLDTIKKSKRDEIPAVTHVDNTTRPQTVEKDINPQYYELISQFEKITGVPVVLNTSFNVAGEPIVESPEQAIQDFYSTGLDVLAIGDYLLTKDSR